MMRSRRALPSPAGQSHGRRDTAPPLRRPGGASSLFGPGTRDVRPGRLAFAPAGLRPDESLAPRRVPAAGCGVPTAGRRAIRSGRSAIAGAVLAVLLATQVCGCAVLFPKNPHKEAQGRWDRVRGRIKLQLAQDQFNAGRVRESELQLKDAIGLDPTSAPAHILAAKLNLEKGELVAAKESLDAAVQYGGVTPEISYLSGVISQRYGDLDAALAYYREAAERAPHCAAYVVAQAETLTALGRLNEALDLIRARRTDFERNATLRALAGDIHTILGQYEAASDAYREAVLLAPDDPVFRLELGVALARARRDEEAIKVLAPVLSQKRDAPWSVRLALGRAYLARDNPSEAREVFRDATRAFPGDAEPWSWLARAAMASGDLITARHASEKATSLSPRDAAAWLTLGYVSQRQKDYACARRALETSLRLEPGDPLAHCLLGQVLEAQGHKGEAVLHYRKALDADADYEWARELLAAGS